jgi:putative ABC transport system permease protein
MLAGSYPAIFLSGFRPAAVLKGAMGTKLQAGFTKPLVVLQFALSAFLIISSMIMYRQMKFITSKDLGYNKEQILVVPTQRGWTPESDQVVLQFRERLHQIPEVISVAGTSAAFTRGSSRNGYSIKGENKLAYIYAVDPYYIQTLGITLVQGRNFDPQIASDSNALIVNEALVKDMKWTDPIGEYLNWKEDTVGLGAKIIGVVRDYNYSSLETAIEPMWLSMDIRAIGNLNTMLIKMDTENLPATMEKISAAWKELYPDKPYDYSFLDEDVAKQYGSHQRWMSIMALSTGFAILISCLGLFGLAGVNAVNRTKEIGIRKVLGAQLGSIFILLNKQYVWLSLIAFVMAIPFSWYVMDRWLSDFQFRITMGWELFAMSIAAGLCVALLTVTYHAVKVALINPAETLKYE